MSKNQPDCLAGNLVPRLPLPANNRRGLGTKLLADRCLATGTLPFHPQTYTYIDSK